MEPNSDRKVSRHAATDKAKCKQMAKKYHWQLVGIEPTSDPILKVDCVFAGDTEFPNYHEQQEH